MKINLILLFIKIFHGQSEKKKNIQIQRCYYKTNFFIFKLNQCLCIDIN